MSPVSARFWHVHGTGAVRQYASVMATWWELAIPVAGTLAGALLGSWLQARNSLRVLKVQNLAAQRADRDKHEHERSMQLLEEKKKQYADFLAVVDRRQELIGNIPERGLRNPDEMEAVGKVEDDLHVSFVRLYFVASPEVLEVADEIYMQAIQDLTVWGGMVNHFVEVARKDLGIGGAVPRGWLVDREPPDSGCA